MKDLIEYLEADRDRVLTGLKGAQTPEAAQAVLEKEADRLLLQYNEECSSVRVRDAASGMMQAVRSSVPFLDSMGEARVWRRNGASGSQSGSGGGFGSTGKTSAKGAGLSGILLGIGAVLTAAAFFVPVLSTGGMAALPALLKGILLPVAGGGCLYFAGRSAGRNARIRIGNSAGTDAPEERIEITIDPEKLWNSLRGAVLVVDRNLAAAREAEAYDRSKELTAASGGKGISAEEIELFSGLLELADADSPQMAADIRYYLHKKDVDVLEWSAPNAAWFELLPGLPGGIWPDGGAVGGGSAAAHAGMTGNDGFSGMSGGAGDGGKAVTAQTQAPNEAQAMTIRPALAQGGRLLRKGLAVR